MDRMRNEMSEMMENHMDVDKLLDEMVDKHNATADDVYNLQSHMKRLQVAFNKWKGGNELRGRTVQRGEDFNMNIDVPTDTGTDSKWTRPPHDSVFSPAPQTLQVPSISPPMPAPAPLPVQEPSSFTSPGIATTVRPKGWEKLTLKGRMSKKQQIRV